MEKGQKMHMCVCIIQCECQGFCATLWKILLSGFLWSPLSGLVDRPAFPPYFLLLFLSFHATSHPTLLLITWITAAVGRVRGWQELETKLLIHVLSHWSVYFSLCRELILPLVSFCNNAHLVTIISASILPPLARKTDKNQIWEYKCKQRLLWNYVWFGTRYYCWYFNK